MLTLVRNSLYNPASLFSRAATVVRYVVAQFISRHANNAYRQSVSAPWARRQAGQVEGAGACRVAAETRRVHARLYDDPQEAQFRTAEGRQGTVDERLRSDRLHRRRGTQPAGALGRADPRRARQGPARRALPHRARLARYAGREGPQAEPLEVRREAAEVGLRR